MSDAALGTLRRLVAPRPALAGAVETGIGRLSGLGAALDRWAAVTVRLIEVNAGPGALIAFIRAGEQLTARHGVDAAVELGVAAVAVCRMAGTAATVATLEAAPAVGARLDAEGFTGWTRLIETMATRAPDAVAALAKSSPTILIENDLAGLEGWVEAGLRATAKDRARRARFFSLADPLSRDLLARKGIGLAQLERSLAATQLVLWGVHPTVRAWTAKEGEAPPRRASFTGRLMRVPERFAGVPDTQAPALFAAVFAHVGAHMAHGGPRFAVGTLKPLQIILTSLIEDARVEALAMRAYPGLRRIWAPFHVARPTGGLIAPLLMARLARALFDPAYEDPDGWVGKGRALFQEALPRLQDPLIAREIGGLLGNDLGQMRIRFEPRTHVVEPAYRDDNMGLWDFGDPPESPPEMVDAQLDAARPETDPDRAPDTERPDDQPEQTEQAGRARPEMIAQAPPIVERWPEWDHAARLSRPDWTTVHDIDPTPAPVDPAEAAPLLGRMRALVGAARTGRPIRVRRLAEGDALDLEACLEAMIARRANDTPDPRVYQSRRRLDRDLATLVLLDASASTAAVVPGAGTNVMGLEIAAADLLARAVDGLGDPLALWGFDSDGRERVRVQRLKGFSDPFDRAARRRLAGLRPGLSTRLGAALRHAGAELERQRANRRLLLLVGDAEPFDIDSPDPDYLIEDARVAVLGLRARGVDCFCLGLADSGTPAGERIFGRRNHIPIRRLIDLPERLSGLYARLAAG